MYGEIIPIFSLIWWKGFSLFGLLIITLLFLIGRVNNKLIPRGLACFLIWDALFYQIFLYSEGEWSLAYSLPLQYCNVMAFFSVIALLTRRQWFYEICLLLGMLAPLQAIITPGFAFRASGFCFYEYYLSHSITIFTPIFLTVAYQMRPRKGGRWWKTPIQFFVFLPFLFLFNQMVGGNYMFIMSPPPLSNPLILGPWPCYLIVWIGFLLMSSFLISLGINRYFICRRHNSTCFPLPLQKPQADDSCRDKAIDYPNEEG